MRLHEVRPGDSPASIAARDDMAGCPRCSRDLLASNSHKETVTLKNGYRTFKDLRVGEKLALPDKWFSGELDALPPSYFAALPHPDGVTPSRLGDLASGLLGDFAALDVASAKIGALSALPDPAFSDAVNDTAAAIDVAVVEVDKGAGVSATPAAPYAQDAHRSASLARQRNAVLAAAIKVGDQPAAFQAHHDILRDFSDALASARLALKTFYGSSSSSGGGTAQPTGDLITPARAAAAAIAADSSYCTSVAQPGSPVNSAVHAFKTAWNSQNPSSPVPVGTGTYEQATADALAQVLKTAPAACPPRGASSPFGSPSGLIPPQEEKGLSLGAILGLGVLGVGAVGGAIYLATRDLEPLPRVRRVRPRPRPSPRRRPERTIPDTIPPWRSERFDR